VTEKWQPAGKTKYGLTEGEEIFPKASGESGISTHSHIFSGVLDLLAALYGHNTAVAVIQHTPGWCNMM
jgi:hypothetical protein